MNTLYNMNVSYTDPIINTAVINLMNNLTQVNDTLLGVNPVEVMNRLGGSTGMNTTGYVYNTARANLGGVTTLAAPMGSPMRVLTGRKLFGRVLQSLLNVFNLNSASPTVTIPQNVSTTIQNASNANVSYAVSALRDPKPMMNSVENYIHSMVTGGRVFLNGNASNGYNYTNFTHSQNMSMNSTNNMNNTNNTLVRVVIPWAHVPFVMRSGASYLDNCQVYRYNGNNFVPTNSCVVLNGTDQNNVLLNCMYFDTIGVGCSNLTTKVLTTNGSNPNGIGIPNSNSGFKATVTSVLAILLIFVF